MPKKKTLNKKMRDFTINEFANAPPRIDQVRVRKKPPKKSKPVTKTKMAGNGNRDHEELLAELEEEEVEDEESEDSTEERPIRNMCRTSNEVDLPIDDRPGVMYPEIIFYHISKYILPEDIGCFALINRAAYAVTKNKGFWVMLYKRYCHNHPKLPEQLRTDSYKSYGLRQTVIRALFYCYPPFVKRIYKEERHPTELNTRIVVNVWYNKGLTYWNVYFKLKKAILPEPDESHQDFIEEMGRVDANPEEGNQVLLITCKSFQNIPPLMGMTLTAIKMSLSDSYRHQCLRLGFNSSRYARRVNEPECEVFLDAVVNTRICDWWHPQYPHTRCVVPRQEPPLLRKNFFDSDEDD